MIKKLYTKNINLKVGQITIRIIKQKLRKHPYNRGWDDLFEP